jgi:hypothetical protein
MTRCRYVAQQTPSLRQTFHEQGCLPAKNALATM